MRIIGIDPGLTNTGWAIVEQYGNNAVQYINSGTIKSKAGPHISSRLYNIFTELDNIMTIYQPHAASIEEVFVNVNSKTSLMLGFARGSILACLGKHNTEVAEFAPNKVKKTIVGHGKAHKEQLQKMLQFVIPNAKFNSADEADAIAIGYAGLVLLSNSYAKTS